MGKSYFFICLNFKKSSSSSLSISQRNISPFLRPSWLIANAGTVVLRDVPVDVAVGDLMINTYNFKDAPEHLRNHVETVYIGTAMNRAHKLQKNQEWIGGALANNVDFGKYTTYLKKYDVPIKINKLNNKIKPVYALNWIKIAKEDEDTFQIDVKNTNELIDKIAKSIGNVDEKFIKSKIENTKKFVMSS